MIVVIGSWISCYLVFLAFGSLGGRWMFSGRPDRFDELLAGFGMATLTGMVLSLFIPLNAMVQGIVLLCSVAYLLLNRISLRSPFNLGWLPTVCITIPVLLLSVPVPNHGDSAFYHAQAIQWIERYPAIPGLGNFFGRLAFNSSLFTTQALFSFHPFTEVSSHYINSFLVLISCLYLFQFTLDKALSPYERIHALVFSILLLLVSRGWVSSAAPDVATGLLLMIIGFRLSRQWLFGDLQPFPLLFFILVLAVTIKLPALFLVPVFLFTWSVSGRPSVRYFILPSLLITAWVIRNFILSGYLVYPYLKMPLFNPDWQVPDGFAMVEKNWISSWARIPGRHWQEVLAMPFTDWFPHWFMSQYLVNRLLIIGFGLTCLALIIKWYIIKPRLRPAFYRWGYLIWAVMVGSWFFTAPDFRFGYGLISPFVVTALFALFPVFRRPAWLRVIPIGPVFPVVLCILTGYILLKEHTDPLKYLIRPQPYPEIRATEVRSGWMKIYLAPGDESCWNHPLPCINDDLFKDHIEPRGDKITDGFKASVKRRSLSD